MDKLLRLFNIPDAELLQHGETVSATMPEDLSHFITFDSTITEAYPTSIQAAITEVKAIKSDQVVIDEMTELTQAANNALAACNQAYRTISFFVRKAFSTNAAVQNQFGLNDIAKSRKNQAKMILFMEDLVRVANKYQESLISQGCNPSVLETLPVLRDTLKQSNTQQEKFKKDRGLITQERVEKLNRLYKLLVPASEMAHIIFADDQARLARYALPRPKSSTNNNDDLIVS